MGTDNGLLRPLPQPDAFRRVTGFACSVSLLGLFTLCNPDSNAMRLVNGSTIALATGPTMRFPSPALGLGNTKDCKPLIEQEMGREGGFGIGLC